VVSSAGTTNSTRPFGPDSFVVASAANEIPQQIGQLLDAHTR